MTASCLSTPRLMSAGATATALAATAMATPRRLPTARGQRRGASGLLLVAALLLLAVLMAPEQPLAQASICERHNGAAACRVW